MGSNVKSAPSFADIMEEHSQRFSEMLYSISEEQQQEQEAAREALTEIAEEGRKYRELQSAGAKASIESRNQLIEQNELLKKQLSEQTEINQRLAHEFEMGAREAVVTRQKANWSLGIGIAGLFVAIIAAVVGVMK